MFEHRARWDGIEWQRHIVTLLNVRYSDGSFQAIPDEHQGDGGLEGFTRQGTSYQCYASQATESEKMLADQTAKIRRDIKKFKDRQELLSGLLLPTKISRWLLVVPAFDNKALIQYANKKAIEVRTANLPYATKDFSIGIVSLDHFQRETALLQGNGLQTIPIGSKEVNETVLIGFRSENATLIDVMDEKLRKLPNNTEAEIRTLSDNLVQWFLEAQNIADDLQTRFSHVYPSLQRVFDSKQRVLQIQSLTANAPKEHLGAVIRELSDALQSSAKLRPDDTDSLVYGKIAEWLMRCPLQF